MAEMSQEKLIGQLAELSVQIVSAREEIERKHDKIEIALTGIFRLLSEEGGSIMDGIHAEPDRLKGYIIRLLSQLRQESLSLCDLMKSEVDSIVESARNP